MLPDDDSAQDNDGVIVSKEQAGMNFPTFSDGSSSNAG
jgi:hypothetical protein